MLVAASVVESQLPFCPRFDDGHPPMGSILLARSFDQPLKDGVEIRLFLGTDAIAADLAV